MTEGQVLDIARQALYTIILCSAPLLIISLVVGLVVSIFQTVTSIQEQTLTFVPKIICVFLGMMHDKFVSRNIHIDIFEVVLVRSSDFNIFSFGRFLHCLILSTGHAASL